MGMPFCHLLSDSLYLAPCGSCPWDLGQVGLTSDTKLEASSTAWLHQPAPAGSRWGRGRVAPVKPLQ